MRSRIAGGRFPGRPQSDSRTNSGRSPASISGRSTSAEPVKKMADSLAEVSTPLPPIAFPTLWRAAGAVLQVPVPGGSARRRRGRSQLTDDNPGHRGERVGGQSRFALSARAFATAPAATRMSPGRPSFGRASNPTNSRRHSCSICRPRLARRLGRASASSSNSARSIRGKANPRREPSGWRQRGRLKRLLAAGT